MAYKYSIQSLWIMRRCQNTSILHVSLQIPELCQPNTRYVDNVGRIGNRNFRIRSLKSRDKGKDKVEEVVVEGEQWKHLCRGLEFLVVGGAVLIVLRFFLVFGHMLAVKALDHVDVDRNTAAVSVAGPLGVLLGSAQARRVTVTLTINRALS